MLGEWWCLGGQQGHRSGKNGKFLFLFCIFTMHEQWKWQGEWHGQSLCVCFFFIFSNLAMIYEQQGWQGGWQR
jgi:hypothetical protein